MYSCANFRCFLLEIFIFSDLILDHNLRLNKQFIFLTTADHILYKMFKGEDMFIPGAKSIPDSRVCTHFQIEFLISDHFGRHTWGQCSAVAALIRGSDFQILADVDLSRFQIADNLLLRHMTQ